MSPQTSASDGHQAGAPQQTEVVGYRRLADGQRGFEVANADLAWATGEDVEDLQTHRVAQELQVAG